MIFRAAYNVAFLLSVTNCLCSELSKGLTLPARSFKFEEQLPAVEPREVLSEDFKNSQSDEDKNQDTREQDPFGVESKKKALERGEKDWVATGEYRGLCGVINDFGTANTENRAEISFAFKE